MSHTQSNATVKQKVNSFGAHLHTNFDPKVVVRTELAQVFA